MVLLAAVAIAMAPPVVVVSGCTADDLMGCLPVVSLTALAVVDGDAESGLSVR